MKSLPGKRLKTYALLAIIIVFAPLGNVLLGKGMQGISAATTWHAFELLGILGQILASPYIWLGIASQLAFFVAYMVVLTWADYSYVQPACAFSYAIVAVLGYVMLGETVSPLRALGIAVICAGVLVVGRTPHNTTESASQRALESL